MEMVQIQLSKFEMLHHNPKVSFLVVRSIESSQLGMVRNRRSFEMVHPRRSSQDMGMARLPCSIHWLIHRIHRVEKRILHSSDPIELEWVDIEQRFDCVGHRCSVQHMGMVSFQERRFQFVSHRRRVGSLVLRSMQSIRLGLVSKEGSCLIHHRNRSTVLGIEDLEQQTMS